MRFVYYKELSKRERGMNSKMDPMGRALTSQILPHREVPEPAEGWSGVDDGEAHEVLSLIVGCEVKPHFAN